MRNIMILALLLAFGMVVFWGCGKDENPEDNGPITPTAYGQMEIYYEYGFPTGGHSIERWSGVFAPEPAQVGWYSVMPPEYATFEKRVLLFFSDLDSALSLESAVFKFYMIDSGLIANSCELILNGIAHNFDDFPSYDSIVYDSLSYNFGAVASGYIEVDVTNYMIECITKGFVTFVIGPQTHEGESYNYGANIYLQGSAHPPQLLLYTH